MWATGENIGSEAPRHTITNLSWCGGTSAKISLHNLIFASHQIQQLRVIWCSQTSHCIPMRHSTESVLITSRITPTCDVGESVRVLIDEVIEETEGRLSRLQTGIVQQREDASNCRCGCRRACYGLRMATENNFEAHSLGGNVGKTA